jgi:hypothetical protein
MRDGLSTEIDRDHSTAAIVHGGDVRIRDLMESKRLLVVLINARRNLHPYGKVGYDIECFSEAIESLLNPELIWVCGKEGSPVQPELAGRMGRV